MNISIPFKKIIPFKSNIEEVCSITLEHDVSINESELLGDFIVSGEYKNLDVNVDANPFEHVIPFSVKLDDDIIIDTLSYEVEDFNYEIINNDSLEVNILFHVTAEKNIKESIFEKPTLSDENNRLEILEEDSNEKKENKVDTNKKVTLIDSDTLEKDYITYHIHLVKAGETVDSICSLYKIEKEKVVELNDITTLDIGDKLIIPDVNE